MSSLFCIRTPSLDDATVRDTTDGLAGSLDVVAIDLEPNELGPGADPVVRTELAIGRSAALRWLVAGDRATVTAVVERTMSGENGLFGLAGAVVLDDTDEPVVGVPSLIVRTTDLPRLAALVRVFWERRAGTGPDVPSATARMIASPRTSTRTRGILAGRALADDPDRRSVVLDAAQTATLRVIADHVVPQDGSPIDLAARVDAALAAGAGDGWRPDVLPPDPEAYRLALDTLAPLGAMTHDDRAVVLDRVADGTHDSDGGLSADQMRAWFEDACVDLAHHWLAHPATMGAVDYDGFANGGDDALLGWSLLAAGTREPWEGPGPGIPTTTSTTTTTGARR